MNATKLLCKYFDDGKKGYVTLLDILITSFVTLFGIFFVSIIVLVIGGLSLLVFHNLLPTYIPEYSSTNELRSMLLGIIFDIIFIGIIYIIYKISQIKVAECDRK